MSTVSSSATDLVRWFSEIGLGDVATVGGKNASLGEMYTNLTPRGIRIPNGFATTSSAYRMFLEESGLSEKIGELVTSMNEADPDSLHHYGMLIRHMILEASLPDALSHAIVDAYHELGDGRTLVDVAVRSSATAEDLQMLVLPASKRPI